MEKEEGEEEEAEEAEGEEEGEEEEETCLDEKFNRCVKNKKRTRKNKKLPGRYLLMLLL